MKTFDELEQGLEDEITKRLNPYGRAARTAAWGFVVLQFFWGCYALMGANVIGFALGVMTSVILIWLLIMSRPVDRDPAPA